MQLTHEREVIIDLGILEGEDKGLGGLGELEGSQDVFVEHLNDSLASYRDHLLLRSQRRSKGLGQPFWKKLETSTSNSSFTWKWSYL